MSPCHIQHGSDVNARCRKAESVCSMSLRKSSGGIIACLAVLINDIVSVRVCEGRGWSFSGTVEKKSVLDFFFLNRLLFCKNNI